MYSMITNIEASVEEPPSTQLGDLRERLNCEYVTNVLTRPGGGGVVGFGSHRLVALPAETYIYPSYMKQLTRIRSKQSFSLLQLKDDSPWTISPETGVLLSGGHGQELVRTFCFLDKVSSLACYLRIQTDISIVSYDCDWR